MEAHQRKFNFFYSHFRLNSTNYIDVGDQKFISRISEGFVVGNTDAIAEGLDCGRPPYSDAAAAAASCSVSSAMFVVEEAVDCVVSRCTPSRLLNSQPLK